MLSDDVVKAAFMKKVEQNGHNLSRIAADSDLPYSVINKLANGKTRFSRMTVGTFLKLFPDIDVDFFGDKNKSQGCISPEKLEMAILKSDMLTPSETKRFLLFLKNSYGTILK